MLNRVVLMGRLCRDPEIKTTRGGVPVCTVTLACERDYADENGVREADFLDVVCWRQTAEFVGRYFRKGLLIACEGRLQARSWTDKQGQKRVTYEVIADHAYFAERAERERIPEGRAADADYTGDLYRLPESGYAEIEDDEDVPF